MIAHKMQWESDQLMLSILGVVLGGLNFFHHKVEVLLLDITAAWPWIDTVAKLLGIVAVLAVIYMNLQVAWKASAERKKIMREMKNKNKDEDA